MKSATRRARHAETTKAWRLRNADRYAASQAKWRMENSERAKELSAKWRAENATKYAEYMKKWREENVGHRAAYLSQWKNENRETVRAANRAFYHANPELWRAYFHTRRGRLSGNGGKFSAQEWVALKVRYGNRCLCCGRDEGLLVSLGLTLTPDHVLPLSKGGRNDIDNIQPLCNGPDGCNNKKFVKHIDYRSILEVI